MSRNLIVCFDGTNNQFGAHDTNVVRLVQALERFGERQLVYYDPGVGTLPEPGLLAQRCQPRFGAGRTRVRRRPGREDRARLCLLDAQLAAG